MDEDNEKSMQCFCSILMYRVYHLVVKSITLGKISNHASSLCMQLRRSGDNYNMYAIVSPTLNLILGLKILNQMLEMLLQVYMNPAFFCTVPSRM